ncbi:MAG: hypothetical protein ACE5O2_07965, partial [Armatimonadota bacterium]
MPSAWLLIAMLLAASAMAQEPRDLDPLQNVALGKTVTYCPAPGYRLTARGDTDPTDLTNGELTKRKDLHMWFESSAVGWSYAGRVNLSVDLGRLEPIDEVAIRFLGGSPQAGICMPGWVEVMVSDGPDEPYYKVAEFFKGWPGDRDKYGIPRYEGKAWVHRLRFTGLKAAGRCVGIRFYGAGLTCSDELYVFRGTHDPHSVRNDPATITDFTVTQAQMYFHKPSVYVSRDIATPLPIGLVARPSEAERPMTVRLSLPAGVRVVGGGIGGVSWDEPRVVRSPDRTQYVWRLSAKGASSKTFGRLYLIGAPRRPPAVSYPTLTYNIEWGDYRSPAIEVPVEVVDIPEQPVMPRRLTTTLGWWHTDATRQWPDWEKAFRHIGLNTLPVFSTWLDPKDSDTINFVAEARRRGFKIQMIDSTWHRMLSRRKKEAEIYCQFEGGTRGSRLCPSYRGRFYQEELQRVATAAALLRPNYLHCDIELWGWRGPVDAEKCTRCRADKEKSGIATWEEWKLKKGEEMWIDLYEAVQGALKEAGAPPCEMGVYDFRPGQAYQFTWPFDRLYPRYMQTSQVSTYTPLEPYHIELVGDEARTDRRKLPRSDQMPWITPGDAGTFSGEALYCAMLECFC